MKAKFGAIVVAGSGKLGGHVFSKNRAGAFMRTKVTPANARTTSQTLVRNRFTRLSQTWRDLTQDGRDAWNTAVTDFARTDIFGDLRNPSGINLFQRLNNILSLIGETELTLPPSPSVVIPIIATDMAYRVVIPELSVVFSGFLDTGMALIVSATAPLSAGKSSVNSHFRIIATLDAPQVSPLNIMDAYIDKFGSLGSVGKKISVRFQCVNIATGQTATPTIISGISLE